MASITGVVPTTIRACISFEAHFGGQKIACDQTISDVEFEQRDTLRQDMIEAFASVPNCNLANKRFHVVKAFPTWSNIAQVHCVYNQIKFTEYPKKLIPTLQKIPSLYAFPPGLLLFVVAYLDLSDGFSRYFFTTLVIHSNPLRDGLEELEEEEERKKWLLTYKEFRNKENERIPRPLKKEVYDAYYSMQVTEPETSLKTILIFEQTIALSNLALMDTENRLEHDSILKWLQTKKNVNRYVFRLTDIQVIDPPVLPSEFAVNSAMVDLSKTRHKSYEESFTGDLIQLHRNFKMNFLHKENHPYSYEFSKCFFATITEVEGGYYRTKKRVGPCKLYKDPRFSSPSTHGLENFNVTIDGVEFVKAGCWVGPK